MKNLYDKTRNKLKCIIMVKKIVTEEININTVQHIQEMNAVSFGDSC